MGTAIYLTAEGRDKLSFLSNKMTNGVRLDSSSLDEWNILQEVDKGLLQGFSSSEWKLLLSFINKKYIYCTSI